MPDRKKQIESLERATMFAMTPTLSPNSQFFVHEDGEIVPLTKQVRLIEFRGASFNEPDEYADRGPIWINPERISCAYSHTILVDGHKIRVMETADEIIKKLTWRAKNDVQSDR